MSTTNLVTTARAATAATTTTTTTTRVLPDTMTAVIYNGDDGPCRISNYKCPQVSKAFPLLIQIYAVSVNPVDAKYIYGDKLPDISWIQSFCVQKRVSTCIPGFDFSGRIVDIHSSLLIIQQQQDQQQDEDDDDGTRRRKTTTMLYQLGDCVYGTVPPFHGTFCQYQVVPIDQIYHMPNHVTFTQAAAIPLIGLTIYQCFEQSEMTSQSHVLIIGASGGAGHWAILYARCIVHVSCIVAICSGTNTNWVQQELGAHYVINYQQSNWKQLLEQHVQQYGPFTHVLDTVTSAKTQDRINSYEEYIRHGTTTRTATTTTRTGQPQTDHNENDDMIPLFQPKTGRYMKLGGVTCSWIAAGIKRVFGWNVFYNKQSELFWVRFPKTSHELKQIKEMMEQWNNNNNKKQNNNNNKKDDENKNNNKKDDIANNNTTTTTTTIDKSNNTLGKEEEKEKEEKEETVVATLSQQQEQQQEQHPRLIPYISHELDFWDITTRTTTTTTFDGTTATPTTTTASNTAVTKETTTSSFLDKNMDDKHDITMSQEQSQEQQQQGLNTPSLQQHNPDNDDNDDNDNNETTTMADPVVAHAFALLRGRHTKGKIVLRFCTTQENQAPIVSYSTASSTTTLSS